MDWVFSKYKLEQEDFAFRCYVADCLKAFVDTENKGQRFFDVIQNMRGEQEEIDAGETLQNLRDRFAKALERGGA